MSTGKYSRHYEESAVVNVDPQSVYSFADDHRNFSAHMNRSSWMMGGGSMRTETDEGKGQQVGSHIRMSGSVFGVPLFLDEVITKHEPPHRKAWETVGDINLIVIDHYTLGFEVKPVGNTSRLTVYIDYNLPQSAKTRWLGYLFGDMYAKWCVRQMISGVQAEFRER